MKKKYGINRIFPNLNSCISCVGENILGINILNSVNYSASENVIYEYFIHFLAYAGLIRIPYFVDIYY